jgi:SsrA-binding protein
MAPQGTKIIATNRQARRNYEVLDTVECGIVLKGSEVKSLRDAHVQFADANGWIRNGEVFLVGLLYFKDGRAKVELALGRGRRQYDKRQAMAKRDADLDIRRTMARARRGE